MPVVSDGATTSAIATTSGDVAPETMRGKVVLNGHLTNSYIRGEVTVSSDVQHRDRNLPKPRGRLKGNTGERIALLLGVWSPISNPAGHQSLLIEASERECSKMTTARGALRPSRPRGPLEQPPSQFRREFNKWLHATKWAALQWIFRRDIAAIRSALGAEPFAAILAQYPDISLKPVRPYLATSLKRIHRSIAVVGHYREAARLLTDTALVESHTSGYRLLAVSTIAGGVTVELAGQGGLYREAEWRLILRLEGRPVVEMGLAIVDRPLLQLGGRGRILWIGALKSASAGAQGLEDSRMLTKAMEGLRPKTLLLLVAQTLASSLKLCGLVAASNAGHVFSSDHSLRRRITADYDSFWAESGGRPIRRTMYALPLMKAQRDPADYKPNKRAQIRRRQRLEVEIARHVSESVRPLLRT